MQSLVNWNTREIDGEPPVWWAEFDNRFIGEVQVGAVEGVGNLLIFDTEAGPDHVINNVVAVPETLPESEWSDSVQAYIDANY